MKVAIRTIYVDRKRKGIDICPFGDIQRGAVGCDNKAYIKFLNWVYENKHVYLIGMGDYDDFLSPSNRTRVRDIYDDALKKLDDTAIESADRHVKELSPIKDRLLGLWEGHHYWRFSYINHPLYGKTTTQYMCEKLGVPYMGDGVGFYRLYLKYGGRLRGAITIFGGHGIGCSRTAGLSLRQIEDTTRNFDADIYIFGHQHKKVASRGNTRLYLDRFNNVKSKVIVCARTGSFLRGYYEGDSAGYIEKALLPPVDVGVVKIHCDIKHNTRKRVGTRPESRKGWSDWYVDLHVSE